MTSALDRVAILRERIAEASRHLSECRETGILCSAAFLADRVRRHLDDALEFDESLVDVDEVNRANE